jgi:hypothetical protein
MAGVSGATAVDGTGLGRALGFLTEDTPLFPSFSSITEAHKGEVRVLFAVVDERVDLDDLIARTEAVVGDLDTPNTGIMVVLPVASVKGLRKRSTS